MKKRIISGILALLLVLLLLPASVFAENNIQYYEKIYINPLYRDVVTEEDLISTSTKNPPKYNSDGNTTYVSGVSKAAAVLRKGIENRQSQIVVNFSTSTYLDNAYEVVAERALDETGVPTQGDYLRWVYAGYQVGISYFPDDNVYYYSLTYNYTYYTTAEQEKALSAKVNSVLESLNISSSASDYDIIRTIYNYVCSHVTYDNEHLYDDSYDLKYTAYAALMNGTSVCQGYACLMYRMLLQEGVNCRVIAGNGHAWNIVAINDLYYNIDSTWDAGSPSPQYYSYFLKNEADFADHIRSSEYTTAEFNSTYPMAQTSYVPQTAPAITISKQPADLKAKSGTTGKFSIGATGNGLTYQWQYQKKGTSTWTNSTASSAKSATFSVSVREAINGYKYRCIVTDTNGGSVKSDTATLTVTPNITKQPTALTAKSGTTGKFTVTATGDGLTYQWQYLKKGSTTWTNSTASSAKSATLSVSVREAINGYKYRCIVKNSCGNMVTSSAVALTVTPNITKQPTNLTAVNGTTGKFTITAKGDGLTYQWQYLKPNGSWTNSTSASGKTAAFSVNARTAINGYKYRCVVKNSCGNSITSSVVTLTIK